VGGGRGRVGGVELGLGVGRGGVGLRLRDLGGGLLLEVLGARLRLVGLGGGERLVGGGELGVGAGLGLLQLVQRRRQRRGIALGGGGGLLRRLDRLRSFIGHPAELLGLGGRGRDRRRVGHEQDRMRELDRLRVLRRD